MAPVSEQQQLGARACVPTLRSVTFDSLPMLCYRTGRGPPPMPSSCRRPTRRSPAPPSLSQYRAPPALSTATPSWPAANCTHSNRSCWLTECTPIRKADPHTDLGPHLTLSAGKKSLRLRPRASRRRGRVFFPSFCSVTSRRPRNPAPLSLASQGSTPSFTSFPSPAPSSLRQHSPPRLPPSSPLRRALPLLLR